jgi:hypothetical protein
VIRDQPAKPPDLLKAWAFGWTPAPQYAGGDRRPVNRGHTNEELTVVLALSRAEQFER